MVPLIVAVAACLIPLLLCLALIDDLEKLNQRMTALAKQHRRLHEHQQRGEQNLAEAKRQLVAVDTAMAEVEAQCSLVINTGRFHELVVKDLEEVPRGRS